MPEETGKGPAFPGASAPAAQDSLRTKEYERLERMLREAESARASAGDPRYLHVLDAAYRLFDTCERYFGEGQAHLQAYFAAHHRELEMLRDLHGLVDMLLQSGRPPAPTPGAQANVDEKAVRPGQFGAHRKDRAGISLERTAHEEDLRREQPEPDASCQAPAGEGGVPIPEGVAEGALESGAPPTLDIYFLSPFQVFRNDSQITDWPNSKGKSLFKYLVANRERPVPKEVLMDVFWPGAEANAARNNLNVAIYGLRKELAEGGSAFSYILFQDGCYLLNPALRVWVDAEAFREHMEAALRLEQQGELEQAIQQYRAAEVLYQAPFLAEDRYEEWIDPLRQATEQAYVEVLDRLGQHYFEQKDYDACALVCRKMLGVDACNEAPHRLLMRCYARLGQPHLALRQFHVCVDALNRELKLNPSPHTVELFRRVKNQQPV